MLTGRRGLSFAKRRIRRMDIYSVTFEYHAPGEWSEARLRKAREQIQNGLQRHLEDIVDHALTSEPELAGVGFTTEERD